MPWIELPDRPVPGLRAQARQEQPWYRFKNVGSDEAELLLYDEIGGWGTYADEFVAELRTVTAPKLRVKVNSPGGSVFEGIALANALRSHPADVTVQVDGIAASIASVIAMAGDRLVMQPNSMLMIHEASGMCLGDAADMQQMAGVLDAISNNIAGAYATKGGGTADDWRSLMKNETWYSAEGAVEAGLADEVGEQRGKSGADAEPEMRKTFDPQAYGYTGPTTTEQQTTLTIDIGSALGDEFVEQMRAAVRRQVEAEASAAEPDLAEPTVVEPVVEAVAAAEPVDEWAGAFAHLLQPEPDPWTTAFAHLTNPEASSSAATEA